MHHEYNFYLSVWFSLEKKKLHNLICGGIGGTWVHNFLHGHAEWSKLEVGWDF